MSGQWEVVGRNKKQTLANKKPGKPEKKNIIINTTTKVEDVLPQSKVKELFNGNGKNNKENKKPQEKEKSKENVKKPTTKKNDKHQESTKIKTHKSIESALTTIQPEDFKSALESSMQKFPDAPIVWLKELSSILNTKIIVEMTDPSFSNKPDGYPLSAVSANIKQTMEKAVQKAGKANAQVFFDNSLTAMAIDLSKNHPAIGHKLWIQLLAINNPQITITNLDKYKDLRISYQNRQPIGLSILWALGQGGIKDFNTGLKVFKDFMMPLLEMKNYSKYVVQYLAQLLKRHENVILSKDNYLYLFDLCHSKHSLPNEASQQLASLSKNLKNMLTTDKSEKKYSTYFEPLLVKLVNSATSTVKNDICNTLVSLLSKDTNCYSTWVQMYIKNLQQSFNLLNYINDHWKKVSPQLDIKRLRETVKTFFTTNGELNKNLKKDAALNDSITVCKILLEKMTVKKSFPWKTLIFIFFISIFSFIIYDVKKHGDWQKSHSVKTLKEIGVWEYGEKTWDKANQGLNWTKQRIEEYAPGYMDVANDYVQSYIELGRDLGLVIYNVGDTSYTMFNEKYPFVIEYVETYVPGLVDTVKSYIKLSIELGVTYSKRTYEFFTKEVFVGELAPENIQKHIVNAYNTTQHYAVEYYHWVYKKIDDTINGK